MHQQGKKRTRGATQEHATADAARAALEKLAASAEKTGWRRSATRSFLRAPDAFGLGDLPKPGKTAKK
jgi:hypothetical protein